MNNPKLQHSLKQAMSDIDYFDALVVSETSNLRRQMNDISSTSPNLPVQLDNLIETISAALGNVSARVRLIEQVLAAEERLEASPRSVAGESAGSNLPESYTLVAEGMGELPNLLALEHGQGGLPFRWTGADASTTFRLPVSRSCERGLSIDIVAVVKAEHLKEMKLVLDGKPVLHHLSFDGQINRASLNMPARRDSGITLLEVKLPSTHRPSELGDSTDSRQIGIAISKVDVGDRLKLSLRSRVRSTLRGLVFRG